MNANEASTKHPHEPEIPPTLDAEGRCLVCRILSKQEALQRAVDSVYAALASTQYVGGLSMNAAYRVAQAALAPLVTQHMGQEKGAA